MNDSKLTNSSPEKKEPGQFFTFKNRKKQQALIAVVLTVVLATGGFIGFKTFGKSDSPPAYTEYTVARGDINVTISGSSTMEPINYYEITALVTGDVTSDTFAEGDQVEKGQLLYTIDSSDTLNSIERAQISLERSNLSYQSSVDDLDSLTVTSPIGGKLSDITVRKGDTIQSNQIIATVYDYNKLSLKVPFHTNDISRIYTGQSVTVTVENTFEVLSGKITKIYNAQRLVDGAVTVTDVDISVDNPGGLVSGTYASVAAGDVSSYSGGTFDYIQEKNITAGVSGMVEEVYCTSGEYVHAGTKIMRLANDDLASSYQSNALSLKDAQLSYQNTQKQLDNYDITAPISGTIIEKTIKSGDIIDSSSSKTIMAVIADMSVMTCTIQVDELDIAKMKAGQDASITADAYSDAIFTGTVENIGLNGSSSNGVTTYPVSIIVNDPEGKLWPGMNVNADIVVESATSILYIPVSAVNRGNVVLAQGEGNPSDNTSGGGFTRPQSAPDNTSGGGFTRPEGSSSSGNSSNSSRQINMVLPDDVPDGYSYRRVTLGINDNSYIEVTSGLSEGDIILVPVSSSAQDGAGTNQMNPMGGGGMMMNMPAGGASPAGGGTRPAQGGAPQ